jgi:pentapeptide MXKDX repeat protein
VSTQYEGAPLSAGASGALKRDRPAARPSTLERRNYLMKKLIAVLIAGLFAVAGAFADEMKKDEKAEAKPAAEAKKEEKKGEMKKAEAKKDEMKKGEMKKAEAKKEEKKDEMKKDEAKK